MLTGLCDGHVRGSGALPELPGRAHGGRDGHTARCPGTGTRTGTGRDDAPGQAHSGTGTRGDDARTDARRRRRRRRRGGRSDCQPQPPNGTGQLLVLLLLPPNPSAASAAWQSLEDEDKERRGRKKKKLMTHNCHDSGIGPGQLFYIPGMYSMQISTKGRHSFSIVDPEGNQISLWQPW